LGWIEDFRVDFQAVTDLNVGVSKRKLEDNEMAFRFDARSILRLVLSVVLVLSAFGAQRLHAQAVGATLGGTITDQSGGVVANAAIVILNTATGETRNVSTNADGIYSAPNLQPGVYSISVTATGFQKTVQPSMTLTVGATQTLNLTMQVGQSNQTVEVTAEAPSINVTNAEIGAITDESQIKELPLNARSWTDLANLQPGVYQLHTQPGISTRDRFTRGYGLQLSISGSRPQQNNYRVDGISINDPGNGGPGSVLGTNAGVDAVAEFSVLTTNYSTEYGRASGGIINATTKSGTNQFHGAAYEFLRNSAMDASNYWDAKDSNGNYLKPQFRRNQFGADAGGPIFKDKTFIFGDYEGVRQSLGLSKSSPIPSATYITNNPGLIDSRIQTYLTSFFPINGTLNGKTVCQIQAVPGSATNFCVFGANQVSSENYFIIRGDHNLTANDRLSVSMYHDSATTGTPDEYNNKVVDTATNSWFGAISWTHTFGSSFVNSARIGFHRDFQGGPAGATALNSKASDATLGVFTGFDAPQISVGGNPVFTGGLTSYNPQKNSWNTYQFYDDAFWTKGKHSLRFGVAVERDQLNVIRSPRPGGVFQFSSMAAFLGNCGTLATATCPALFGSGVQKVSTDLPGLTAPSEPRQTIFGVYFQDDWKLRPNLTINLGLRYEPTTVPSDPKGRNATLASIYDTTGTQLPLCGMQFKNASGNVTCNAQTNGLFRNNSLHDFDPRIGFAWDPQNNGKMSVRGGIGLYDQLPLIAFMGSSSSSQTFPFLLSGSSGHLLSGSLGPYASYPGASTCTGTPLPMACQVSAGGVKGSRTAYVEQNPKRAYVMQWNFSVERELLPNLTLMVGYVGSHGIHGTTQVDDVNIVLPTKPAGTYLWPCDGGSALPVGGNINQCPGLGSGTQLNATIGRLPATFFRNSSVYHGLEVQVTKKISHGFQVNGSFTFQKSIDTASGAVISDSVITAISSLNWFDPKLTRGVSDFNDAKIVSMNGLWNIPTPKTWTGFLDKAVGGWQVGGIFSASSGQPFSAILAGDPLGLNNSDSFGYPNRLASCGNNLTNPGNRNNYVKLQCFQIPAPVNVAGVNYIPLGNAGRNIMTGPGLVNMDLSFEKSTKIARISDTFSIKFRFDMFNITNRPNFNPPVQNEFLLDPSTLNNGVAATPGPTGGCLSNNQGNSGCVQSAGALSGPDGTSTTSRQMQVSLKVIW
jgi:hypothetical protein